MSPSTPLPGSLTTTWTKVSGPGTVTFGSASAVDTTAEFSAAGSYVMQLEADDSEDDDIRDHAARLSDALRRVI